MHTFHQTYFLHVFQSVVSRMSNIPLVSSACGAVVNAYSTTKDSVPLLKGVMEVAETGMRTLGAVATTGSKPILDRLEPQREYLSFSLFFI